MLPLLWNLHQGTEQLRQVRRPLVQMAAVKLGSQTLGEVLLLVKWLQSPNFVDYCRIRQMKRPTEKQIWGLKAVKKREDMQCLKLRSVVFISNKQPIQQAFSPPTSLMVSQLRSKVLQKWFKSEAGGGNHLGILCWLWNLLNRQHEVIRPPEPVFSLKSSEDFNWQTDERVRKGSKMSQLTVICVNLKAKAQIVNCLHGIAYRDQYPRNASFLRSDIATRQTWQCSAKLRKMTLDEVLRSSLIMGDMPKFELEVAHGQECL